MKEKTILLIPDREVNTGVSLECKEYYIERNRIRVKNPAKLVQILEELYDFRNFSKNLKTTGLDCIAEINHFKSFPRTYDINSTPIRFSITEDGPLGGVDVSWPHLTLDNKALPMCAFIRGVLDKKFYDKKIVDILSKLDILSDENLKELIDELDTNERYWLYSRTEFSKSGDEYALFYMNGHDSELFNQLYSLNVSLKDIPLESIERLREVAKVTNNKPMMIYLDVVTSSKEEQREKLCKLFPNFGRFATDIINHIEFEPIEIIKVNNPKEYKYECAENNSKILTLARKFNNSLKK